LLPSLLQSLPSQYRPIPPNPTKMPQTLNSPERLPIPSVQYSALPEGRQDIGKGQANDVRIGAFDSIHRNCARGSLDGVRACIVRGGP
jgi:hypothetical protein